MYFAQFPVINYSLDGGVTSFPMTDIFRRIRAVDKHMITSLAYEEYDIDDSDTPEILAAKIYNDPLLHWVILLTNEVIDPRWDWPMTSHVLREYIINKYGEANIGAVHHYINADNDIVHSTFAGTKYPVSNYDYENELNEQKRRIKVLKPQYVPIFVKSFKEIMRNG